MNSLRVQITFKLEATNFLDRSRFLEMVKTRKKNHSQDALFSQKVSKNVKMIITQYFCNDPE